MKKFKIGQHIRLKSLPNSNIEITGINNAGYIYMGDAVVNGSIIGKEQKVIPFKFEDDYEVIDCGDWCESVNKCDYKKTSVSCYAYGIVMKMADWKDEYYKKLLDLLVESGANADIITNYIKDCIEL